jgi:hypothetical protein
MKPEIVTDQQILSEITEYVYANYKSYKNKNLIIKESDNLFLILHHENGSPLFLGKGILK